MLAALVVVLIVIIAVAANSCGKGQEAPQPDAAATAATQQPAADAAEPDRDTLAALIGDELADQMIADAASNPDLYWIAAHPEAIDFEGTAVQTKLLKLAATEHEAIPYVRHYADDYPMEEPESTDKGSSIANDTAVPHLYQWDPRWGYTVYSSTGFGLTGCCPTAFAMVYQGLTGQDDMSPYDMGVVAQEMGYMSQYQGTSAAFLQAAASRFGLGYRQLSVDSASLEQALQSGEVVVANMATGYFSEYSGHYVVLTGLDDDGKVVMNDPYHPSNSAQTWETDFLIGECKGLHAFSKA